MSIGYNRSRSQQDVVVVPLGPAGLDTECPIAVDPDLRDQLLAGRTAHRPTCDRAGKPASDSPVPVLVPGAVPGFVPVNPVSHGCVRILMDIAAFFHTMVRTPRHAGLHLLGNRQLRGQAAWPARQPGRLSRRCAQPPRGRSAGLRPPAWSPRCAPQAARTRRARPPGARAGSRSTCRPQDGHGAVRLTPGEFPEPPT